MPARAKVTKEMIVDAAFAIAREAGVEHLPDQIRHQAPDYFRWF